MLQPDMTKLMNPQWAKWFDTVALAQGQDPSQPYNLNLRAGKPRKPISPMEDQSLSLEHRQAQRVGGDTRISLQTLKDMYGVNI